MFAALPGLITKVYRRYITLRMIKFQENCLVAKHQKVDESVEQSSKIKLSVLTNSKGLLNKTIDIDENGGIFKTHSQPMTNGTIQRYDIDFSKLGVGLSSLKENQCFCHGVVQGSDPGDEYQVVTAKQRSSDPQSGKISRTQDFIEFRGRHISMLDYDPDDQCPYAYISAESIIQILTKLDPQWSRVGYWLVPSSSAGLYVDGKPVDDKCPGYHLYFEAENAEHLNDYMGAIFKLTVIAGHGWVKLSSNGAMNIRSCFDGSVYSPERIDFTAQPTLLSKRLSQQRPEPKYHPGNPIDCSQIPEVDEVKYKEVVETLKKNSDLVKRSKDLAEQKASEISKNRNISLDRARQLIQSQVGGDLHTEDVIIFKNLGEVSVADVMLDFKKYNQESCADPCEPEQGTGRAKFFANGGVKPLIHSMLHGGQNYYFPVDPKNLSWSYEDAVLTVSKVDRKQVGIIRKSINSLVEDILLNNDFSVLEMNDIKTLIKRYLGINKGALDQVIESTSIVDEGLQELTHRDIAVKYIDEHLSKSLSVIGSEGCLWVYNDQIGLYCEFSLTQVEDKIGEHFPGKNCKKGSDYKAISRLVYNKLEDKDFFSDAPSGVPAKSHFIRISDDGSINYEPYTPYHRQRFKLAVDPQKIPAPLFKQYLIDTFGGFEGIPEVDLLQQIMGGLISGTFRKIQRAVLLKGNGSNGKSALLEMLGEMFPSDAICTVSPHDLDQEYCKAELCGKTINIVGELDASKPLRASFKDIIGCDTAIRARKLYENSFKFKPKAGHIFASNHFPQTEDHSHGFYRRWVILSFNNTVQDGKKIPNLGALIAEKELPLVLAWALIGAEKLTKNNFNLPLTGNHKKELENWKVSKDSVYGFLSDEDVVEACPGIRTPRKEVYKAYCRWCGQVGMKTLGYNTFINKVDLKYPKTKRTGEPRTFKGLRLKQAS